MNKKRIYIILFLIFAVLTAIVEIASFKFANTEDLNFMIKMIISRALGSISILFLICYLDSNIFSFKNTSIKSIILIIPCLLVAINNFPLVGLINGSVTITKPNLVFAYILECLFIAFFEELAFRGLLTSIFFDFFKNRRYGAFIAILLSSIIFGLTHILNLFMGAGFLPTLLQVGYSFLIGAMCAFILLKTKNIIFSILTHFIFNLGGMLVESIGEGIIWNNIEIIITAVLGVIVASYVIYMVLKSKNEELNGFIKK